MRARQTSINVYHQIKSEGLLKKMQLEAYDILYHHGPLTGNEVFYKSNRNSKSQRHSFPQRIGELVKKGCVTEVGTKLCEVTKRDVSLYDVTNKLPVDFIKPLTKKEKKKLTKKALDEVYIYLGKPKDKKLISLFKEVATRLENV